MRQTTQNPKENSRESHTVIPKAMDQEVSELISKKTTPPKPIHMFSLFKQKWRFLHSKFLSSRGYILNEYCLKSMLTPQVLKRQQSILHRPLTASRTTYTKHQESPTCRTPEYPQQLWLSGESHFCQEAIFLSLSSDPKFHSNFTFHSVVILHT